MLSIEQQEGYRKTFEQLRGQYGQAAAQLQQVRGQLQGKEREKKATVLTLREIEALPRDQSVKCYKGVGRMFVQESRNNVENSLKSKDKEVGEELSTLNKKAKYYESEMKISEGSLKDLIHSQRDA